jgi:hypothetical protein
VKSPAERLGFLLPVCELFRFATISSTDSAKLTYMLPELAPFIFIAVAICFVLIALNLRAKAMHSLADRLGYEYIKDGPLSDSFCMTSKPFDQKPMVWNILEGERDGTKLLIFDSVVGKSYRTVIAVHSDSSPYALGLESYPGETIQSDGWSVLIKRPILYGLWGMSIHRIEEILNNLLV